MPRLYLPHAMIWKLALKANITISLCLNIFFAVMSMAQISYLPGWPQNITGYMTSPIAISDMDNDGQNEIVVSDSQPGGSPLFAKLYLFNYDGTLKSGWPIEQASSYNAPAIADLDDDGKLEMLSIYAGIHCYKADGTLLWEHLYTGPIFQGIYAPSNASIADIDDDGNLEIIVTCGSGGAIFIFDVQGNMRPGWPVLLTRPDGWTPPPIYKSASIGDIDSDGLREIVVGVDDGTTLDPSRVHCFKPNGFTCSGFPVGTTRQGYRSQAVLLDIDSDGYLEIIIGKETTQLNVYRYDGSLFPGYPLTQSARGIAVGDIDLDGDMDMVTLPYNIRGNDLLSGAMLPNFPFSDPSGQFFFGDSSGSPNICNISDVIGQEIIAGSSNGGFVPDGKLFAFNIAGEVLPNFPSQLLVHRWLESSCAVNDVNGDVTTDICCGSENDESIVPRSSTVYCWDTGYSYNLDNVDWAMDGFDLGHTGMWRKLYHISKLSSQLSVGGCPPTNPCYLPPDGNLIPVVVSAVRQTNGQAVSGQDVRYSRTLGCGNYEGPVIDNGDGIYTRMLRAPTAECTTDIHAWVNEFKLNDYQTIIFRIPNPKEASPIGIPMTAVKGPGTSVIVNYTPGCGATTHSVYWGSSPISSTLNWSNVACNVPCDGAFDPGDSAPGEWTYFVVVGQNSTLEGSYGTNSLGQERPEASGFGSCDKPQDLTGTCP